MALPDTTVKCFNSSMSGAPSLSGTAGTLIGVLDACLVNGFGSVTLDSLVVEDDVATGTISTGHNFAMIGETGPVITIAGATPSELNGDWRIASVPSTTTFTFETSEISDQTATGTITAKRASAGWTKLYSGTDKAVYQRSVLSATAMVLRVDDSPAQYPTLIMYETMSDVDTGTGPAPTTGSVYFAKSTSANSSSRPWNLYADDYLFYLFADPANTASYASTMVFGDIVPYNTADIYHALLLGHAAANTTCHFIYIAGTTTGCYLARNFTGLGSAVSSNRYSHGKFQYISGSGMSVPNLNGHTLQMWPIDCWEYTSSSSTWARGIMPGIFCPLNTGLAHQMTYVKDNTEYIIQQVASVSYTVFVNLSGPWR